MNSEMISKENGDIWVFVDLNYPKLDWDKEVHLISKQDVPTHSCMIVSLRLCQLSVLARWCVNLLDRVISWICS